MSSADDTITAISTPWGVGGIGIVRISGPRSLDIISRIFRPRKPLTKIISHRLYLGEIFDPNDNNPIDEVLVSYMKSPYSYTREDLVEINCHSGYLVLEKVLDLVLKEGARLAEPGGFTKRAFLRGRINLDQAEAIIDLIHARTDKALKYACMGLKGKTSQEIKVLRDQIFSLLVQIEGELEFPEDDLYSLSYQEIEDRLHELNMTISRIRDNYKEGKIYRQGISIAIVGKPNTGKSSLLNRLLGEDRAIVTSMPGTTRDLIEEFINIRGIPFKLIDTAGIRKAKDLVEIEGIKLAKERIKEANLILFILDGSSELEEEDHNLLRETEGKRKVFILNKIDLPLRISQHDLKVLSQDAVVKISALHGWGIDELREKIYQTIRTLGNELDLDTPFLFRKGQMIALSKASRLLSEAMDLKENHFPLDLLASDLKLTLDCLGEITGETVSDQVLDQVFSQFCIGK